MNLKMRRSGITGSRLHFIVAALIERDDKLLLMDRLYPPLGYACPQGHIEEGETELNALEREVLEETQLTIVNAELVHEGWFAGEKCRHRVKYHHWHIYRCEVDGTPKKNGEAKSLDWYSREKLATLPLEPAWEEWFTTLGYLPKKTNP